MSPIDLTGVPETLLLPLWGRAVDARSPRPILRDTQADALATRLGLDDGRVADKLSDYSSLYWARRALLIDGIIRDFARRHPGGLVVNMGAGLDTTFTRVDDGQLRLVGVDLPEVIRWRQELIPESERHHHLTGSLLEEAWIDTLGLRPGDPVVLIVFAGVLFYFQPAQVTRVLRRLSARLPGAELAHDILSPIGAWLSNRYLRRVGMGGAPIVWTARDGRDVERLAPGLRTLATLPIFDDSVHDPSWPLGLRARIWLTERLPIGRLLHQRVGRSD